MFTLNCKGKLISTKIPLVMGIINATPDSFYEGNLVKGMDGILALAEKMVTDGATILDIGGQSTRPNSNRISVEEELARVIPVLKMIHTHFPETVISIDTYQSKVALAAVQAGASMVNDISGGQMDTEMLPTIGAMGNVPYICMHTKGTPENMQSQTKYDDVTKEVLEYFIAKIEECKNAGIKDVIIDPGFGFAKNAEQNFTLLKNLSVLKMLDKALLVGVSRKSSIYKTLNITAAGALNGTTVLNTLALYNGANIIRVHDVRQAIEAVTLIQHYNEA
jgi:dihydropteroate synthase